MILLFSKTNNKYFNKIRNYNDDPNSLMYMILLFSKANSKCSNKISLDKFNYLISLI